MQASSPTGNSHRGAPGGAMYDQVVRDRADQQVDLRLHLAHGVRDHERRLRRGTATPARAFSALIISGRYLSLRR